MVQDIGPSASSTGAAAERYGSARSLAEAFKSPIFEPTWWPDGVGEVTYQLDRLPASLLYKIESVQADGAAICVIGGPETPPERLPTGNWHQPPELAALDGLVRTDGVRVHVVVHDQQQTIHLIGYGSEADAVRATKSLRRVAAD